MILPPSRLTSSVNATSSPELFLIRPRQTPAGSAFFLQAEKTRAKMTKETRLRPNPSFRETGETRDGVIISVPTVPKFSVSLSADKKIRDRKIIRLSCVDVRRSEV